MKKLLLLAAGLLLFTGLNAQVEEQLITNEVTKVPPLPVEDGKIVYQGAVELEGYPQELLFHNGAYWLRNNIEKPEDIRVADKGQGIISGIGKILYNKDGIVNGKGQGIYFDFDVRVKEGGYTYRISQPYAITPADRFDYSDMYSEELRNAESAGKWPQKFRYDTLTDMHSYITLWISSFKTAMAAR